MNYDEFLNKLEMAAAQKALEKSLVKFNARPIDDFCGLSSDQMTKVLKPVGLAGSAITLHDAITEDALDQVPMFRLVEEMLRIAIREGKLEMTKPGYLKRKVIQELYAHGFIKDKYIEEGFSTLRSEWDWAPVGYVRGILEVGRWVRSYKGNVVLTKLGKELAAAPRERLFREVFDIMTNRMYWSNHEDSDEFAAVQNCAGFSFWLTDRFGSEWRTADYYGDKFLTAFPMALPEFDGRPVDTGFDELMQIARKDNPGLFARESAARTNKKKPPGVDLESKSAVRFKSIFSFLTFERYMSWLGIVQTKGGYPEPQLIRRTALFGKLIRIDTSV